MTSTTERETAELNLRAAIDSGDRERIDAAAAEVDRLDEPRAAVPLVAAALWYAEQGLRIFPLRPGSKIPFPGSRGLHDATTDPETIRAWWAKAPEANIGIATGHGVDVVDVDGYPGHLARAGNWAMFSALNVIGSVSTPRAGGMHYFVPAAGVGNKAGLLDHVDYRGLGGYVVAPPSVINSGPNPGRYAWVTPLDVTAMQLGGAA